MAIDVVRPLKYESTASGGNFNDILPTEVQENDDYIISKGYALQNQNTYIDVAIDGQIEFIDPVNGTHPISDFLAVNAKNVDGGFANSVYLAVQHIDGGGA